MSAPAAPKVHRLLAPPRPGRRGAWLYALRTTNPPPDRPIAELDGVTRWIVVTRAAVLPMTLLGGLVAGLLAVRADGFSYALWALATLGIVLAHLSNNLLNDLADTDVGLDTEHYPRALYAPHPFLSGLVTRRQLLGVVLAVNLADLVIMLVLFAERGWPVIAFALVGLFLSYAYTAPPLRLKKRGLGEPDVLLTWGPLMVAGTYFSAVGHLPWQVWVASVPYGLLCTSVLMGKHIDKIPYDEPTGTRTLPVLLGEPRARAVTEGLLISFYVTTLLAVLVGALPWPVLAVAAGVPTLVRVLGAFRAGRPEHPPEGFPVWPLWFAAICFVHVTRAGAALVLGLAVAAATGWGCRCDAPDVTDLVLTLLAALVVVAVVLAVLLALTVAPFVTAVGLAERGGLGSARWGAAAALCSLVGLAIAALALRHGLGLVPVLLGTAATWSAPVALVALGGSGGTLAGARGRHE